MNTTDLEILIGPYQVLFRIKSDAPMRMRKLLALMIFREMKPMIRDLKACTIEHWDENPMNWSRTGRSISFGQVPPIWGLAGSLGFRIRMRRMELGWTQCELAKRVQLSPTHLSEIEHGGASPRAKTIIRLEKALGIPLKQTRNETRSSAKQGESPPNPARESF